MKQIKKAIVGSIVIPLSFILIGYIFIGIMFQPYIRPLLSIYDLFSMDGIPNFTEVSKNFVESSDAVLEDGYFNTSTVADVSIGDTYGSIVIEAVDINVPLLYGATEKSLYYGAAQRVQSSMPGFRKPIMIGGHTIPYFKNLGMIKPGDSIVITTYYGKFTYQVTGTNIILASDEGAYDLTQDKEQLILFTCYPLDGIGEKEERLLVYADKVSGPQKEEASYEK